MCGDKILNLKEGCDDGNLISGDGCSSLCQIEATYTCVYVSTAIGSVCFICGNGVRSVV